ncbi:hypothetical protein CMI37_26075 [Candidatus Pacearchaeota archaeon]|nr:hypothetical protein [Candidatus Pacearchaeota archaeon]|tara:strand:- start:19936 stop:20538 length:603 start_codon:yes stop_codon:yes gene_type:complete
MGKKPIIVFCGLMGSGKTTLSKYFLDKFDDYQRFNTDDVRRILGKTVFDRKDTPMVNQYMYSRARELISAGKGVVFDSAYKLQDARQKIYKIAREMNTAVLVIECTCSSETAIKRITSRPIKDKLHQPTRDVKVYYEYAKIWESPSLDLKDAENAHVSLAKINTDENKLEIIKISDKDDDVIKAVMDLIKKELNNFNPLI